MKNWCTFAFIFIKIPFYNLNNTIMTIREVAKLTSHRGFGAFLTQNTSVFSAFIPFVTKVELLKELLKEENELAKTQTVESTGHTDNKNEAKKQMSQKAALLSGLALVAFKDKGMTLEASQLHVSTSDYSKLADAEAQVLAEAGHDLMTKHLDVISPDYITVDELAELQVLISEFSTYKGTVTTVKHATPAQTGAFKAALLATDNLIDELRLLGRKFREKNPSFYDQLIANSTMPAVSVNHTTFSAKVQSKPEGIPVPNAVATLTTSNKVGNSDTTGFLTIEQVRSGVAALTVKAQGYKDLVLQINLDRGRDNHVDVALERLAE